MERYRFVSLKDQEKRHPYQVTFFFKYTLEKNFCRWFKAGSKPLGIYLFVSKPILAKSPQTIERSEWFGCLCRRHTRKKVVVTANRCECVYKRTGEPSVPFYEKGGTVKQVTDFFK